MRVILRWIYCFLSIVCTIILIAALFAPFDDAAGGTITTTTIKKMYLLVSADALFISTFLEFMETKNNNE